MEKLLTVADVAAVIGVTKMTIRNYIRRKTIIAEKQNINGNLQWMIPHSQVEVARAYAGIPKDDFSQVNNKIEVEAARLSDKLEPNMAELAAKFALGELNFPQLVQCIQNEKGGLKSPENSVKIKSPVIQEPAIIKPKPLLKADEYNWIFIGDLHEPFTDPRYRDFVEKLIRKYNIDKKILLGDECFPGDAKIMTEKGWVRFDEYVNSKSQLKVMQVDSDLSMSLVIPERTVKKQAASLVSYTHGSMSVKVTPNHNLVKQHPITGKIHKREAWDMDGSKSWYTLRSANYVGGKGWNLSEWDIKLMVAFQADGTFTKGAARFTFSKVRKYTRLLEILANANINYTEHNLVNGQYQVYIKVQDTPEYLTKLFSKNPLEANLDQMEIFFKELQYWDGTVTANSGFRYSTKIKANAEYCHTIGTLLNYKCSLKEFKGEIFAVDYFPIAEKCSLKSATQNLIVHNDDVYCVTVPTGMILVMQDGWSRVCGNCDHHSMSFHDSDPDGHGAGNELELAKANIKLWYEMLGEAIVTQGNHTVLAYRKAFNAGMSSKWVKSIQDVLEVPKWDYVSEFETDKFIVGHGDDGKLMKTKVLPTGKSYIQGHFHSDSMLQFYSEQLFGMQVGCGVDKESYAFKYANKGRKRFIHSVGLYVDGNPMLITMK